MLCLFCMNQPGSFQIEMRHIAIELCLRNKRNTTSTRVFSLPPQHSYHLYCGWNTSFSQCLHGPLALGNKLQKTKSCWNIPKKVFMGISAIFVVNFLIISHWQKLIPGAHTDTADWLRLSKRWTLAISNRPNWAEESPPEDLVSEMLHSFRVRGDGKNTVTQ